MQESNIGKMEKKKINSVVGGGNANGKSSYDKQLIKKNTLILPIKEYVKTNSVDVILKTTTASICGIMEELLKSNKFVIVGFEMITVFLVQSIDTEIERKVLIETPLWLVDKEVVKWYENCSYSILNNVKNYKGGEYSRVFQIHLKLYNEINRTSYLNLPKTIEEKDAVLNIQNVRDEACFAWCVIAGLSPTPHNSSNLTTSYPHYKAILKMVGLQMPIRIEDIPKFEERNFMSINVFGIDIIDPNEKFLQLYVTRNKKNVHVNLLLISDNKKSKYHYCLIKHFSRLMNQSPLDVPEWCDMCMTPHGSYDELMSHTKNECSARNSVYIGIKMPVANPAASFEDDSDVSLDLHVSDNEEEEKHKSNDIAMENEDDILNKFDVVDDVTKPKQKLDKANGTIGRKVTETANQNKKELTLKDAHTSTDVVPANGVECNGTETSKNEASSECDINDENKSENVEAVQESSKDEGENEDLLLVMQETTSDAEENHDEASNSDDVEEDSGENNETAEETTQNEEIIQTDEGNESKDGQAEDDDAMEIEDPPDHIDIIEENVRMSGQSETVIEPKEKTDEILPDNAENKTTDNDSNENGKNSTPLENDDRQSVLKSILTNYLVNGRKETSTKPSKRLLEEGDQDTSKRVKLDTEANSIVKLTNFKQFMLDKKMTGLTRDQLEELCIQKMCECIVQRSEIGELKMKIKAHEQVLDSLRKEAVLLGKQTRDLNIVHQKVIQDVSKMQENRDKPLILPKITRSVGLQAYVRNDDTRKSKKIPIATSAATLVTKSPKVNGLTPVVTRPMAVGRHNPQQKPVATTSPRQHPIAKSATQTSPIIAVGTPTRNDKGVIDLTDEDDRAKNMHPNIPNGTKVNMINPPNGHKFVVMPNGQPMMVKLGPMKPTSNIVVTQPFLRSSQNGVTNVPNSSKVVRTSNVRLGSPNIGINSGKRLTAPVQGNIRSRNSYPLGSQKIIRHPAPLPIGPDQPGIYSSKSLPPKPQLMLNKSPCGTGIVLSWKMPYKLDLYEEIASYQLYAYQETKSEPKTDSWGKIGDVKALELPMAVTLTQFAVGNRYYFAVRAVDVLTRHGSFSDYQTILL